MKKLLMTVLTAIMLFSLAVSVTASGLTASVDDCIGYRGDTVTFAVHLSETTVVKSGSVRVSYDASVLELVGGHWVINGVASSTFDPATGSGTFQMSEATGIGGSVFSATFVIKEDAPFETYTISLVLSLEDAAGNSISLRNESGSLTVRCKHVYDRQVVDDEYERSPATCTRRAVYYYSCACGAKGSETFEYGEKLPHAYDWRVTTEDYLKSPATCTQRAVYYYSCVCGARGTETFVYGEPLAHTYDQQVVTDAYRKSAATCTEPAAYYYSCSCGATGTESFSIGAPLGHTGGSASCTQRAVCSRCGQAYGERLPHIFDREVTGASHKKSDADCLNAAVYYKSCHCGANGTATFTAGTALGHTGGSATCTARAVCARCNQPYGEKRSHTYDREVIGNTHKKSEADCLNAAVYYKSCVCGANGTETFTVGTALGHTGGTATCTAKAVCRRCDQPYGEKLPHTFDREATGASHKKSDADCLNAATYYKSCICGANGTETFAVGDALGHTEVVDAAVAATCTAPGLTEGKHCASCGAVLAAQEEIAALGHEFGDWISEKNATCTEAGKGIRTCSACGETETKEISPEGHAWVEATCAEPKTCTACGATSGKPAEHSYGEWFEDRETGARERICSDCGRAEMAIGCVLCGGYDICISSIPLCWLCVLVLVLLLLLALLVICMIVYKKCRERHTDRSGEEWVRQDINPDEAQ